MAAGLNVRSSTVSKMIDRLQEKGLAERSTDPRDCRLTLIRLTSSGVEIQHRLRRIRVELDAEVLRCAEAEGVEISAIDLQGVDRVLSKRLHRLR